MVPTGHETTGLQRVALLPLPLPALRSRHRLQVQRRSDHSMEDQQDYLEFEQYCYLHHTPLSDQRPKVQ